MKKTLEITLGAIADLDESINLLKSEIPISDSNKNSDLRKIIPYWMAHLSYRFYA